MFFRVASIVTNLVQSFFGCGFRGEFNSFHLSTIRFTQVNGEDMGESKKNILNSPSKPLVEKDRRTLVIGDDRFLKRDSIGFKVDLIDDKQFALFWN